MVNSAIPYLSINGGNVDNPANRFLAENSCNKVELKLEFDVRKEILTTGVENVVAAFAGVASPGYPQVKFNILSYGIIHNTLDRRVGAFVGIFCGFFWILILAWSY